MQRPRHRYPIPRPRQEQKPRAARPCEKTRNRHAIPRHPARQVRDRRDGLTDHGLLGCHAHDAQPRQDPSVDVRFDLPDPSPTRPAAVAFGNFDGVHVGHQALLADVRRAADRLGGPATVVTFDPHPLAILRPEGAPPAVDTLATRLDLLRGLAMDRVIVLTFDRDLAARSADWFARDVLVQRLHARHVSAGPDVRFGHGGLGRLDLLQRVLAEVGGTVEPFAGVWLDGQVVSSSRVRRCVTEGDMPLAERLLGRPFCLRGAVIHGDARGRSIGFPTANLQLPGSAGQPGQVLPAIGVYACVLRVEGQALPAVMNLGMRPTFDGTEMRIEAHVLDWQGDLYGRHVELDVLERLRGEQKFAGIEQLMTQITRDVEQARQVIARWRGEGRAP